jgi:hypothetical protein
MALVTQQKDTLGVAPICAAKTDAHNSPRIDDLDLGKERSTPELRG